MNENVTLAVMVALISTVSLITSGTLHLFLSLFQESFVFGGVYCGSKSSLPFTIYNQVCYIGIRS